MAARLRSVRGVGWSSGDDKPEISYDDVLMMTGSDSSGVYHSTLFYG